MATKTRKRLADEIEELCEQAGCSDKIKKFHNAQYCDRSWNPHPPRAFLSWWNKDGAEQTESYTERAWVGIDAVRAFNCEVVREKYRGYKLSPDGTKIPIGDGVTEKDLMP